MNPPPKMETDIVLLANRRTRLRRPVPVGERIRSVGEIIARRGRIVAAEARAELRDQAVAAEAAAKFILI